MSLDESCSQVFTVVMHNFFSIPPLPWTNKQTKPQPGWKLKFTHQLRLLCLTESYFHISTSHSALNHQNISHRVNSLLNNKKASTRFQKSWSAPTLIQLSTKVGVYWLQHGSTFTDLSITFMYCDLYIIFFKSCPLCRDIPQVMKLSCCVIFANCCILEYCSQNSYLVTPIIFKVNWRQFTRTLKYT